MTTISKRAGDQQRGSDFLRRLRERFPADRVLTGAGHLLSYESDALTAFQVRPQAVVLAESRSDVMAAIASCHEFGVPFVARGSGTSLSGGSLPIADGLVLALNRMNRILEIDPVSRLAVVEPGVVNLSISEAVAQHGLYYAPDPSSQSVCTIGGNVAFNSGGAHCLKYGMTSNHILELELVLPTGEAVRVGDRSCEAVGADEVGLFVGSEGLFGVATEIVVRLLPLPERVFTLLASYRSLQSAGDAVSAVIASGLLPGAMEIMDRLAIEAAEAAVSAGYPRDAAALLIVELEGDAAQVEAEAWQLEQVIAGTGPDETRRAEDAEDRARIWKGRKGAFSAVGRLSPDYLVQDGVVPRSRLGEALARVEDCSRRHGLRVANVFHAGDGNLHPLILYDGRVEGELERAEELAGELLQMCIELGGSITGEHGVGMEKRDYLPEMYGEADLDVMKRLRDALDPGSISNRGKMFPDAEAPALLSRGPHPLERAGVLSRE